jgi:AcrR family transcriptional regulator
MTSVIDHRRLPRRRGRALEQAILTAALAELADGGYANLTMERVAERARASKASVYSRWPTRVELVMDVFCELIPDPATPPDTGSLRGDLLTLFRQTAGLLAGPAGEALRGLLADVLPDPVRTAEMRRRSQHAGRSAVEVIARRAVARGEISEGAVTIRRLEAGPAMLRHQFLFEGGQIPDDVITGIIDDVVLPLLTSSRSPTLASGARQGRAEVPS